MNEYNKKFEAHLNLSENEYQMLRLHEKIFVTTAWFTDVQAKEVMGDAPEHCPYSSFAQYGGSLIADNFQHAELVAIERGYSETIDGVLIDEIPYEEAGIPQNMN